MKRLILASLTFAFLFAAPLLQGCDDPAAESAVPAVKVRELDSNDYKTWQPGADCRECHEEAAVLSPEACPHLAKNDDCTSCHTDEWELEALHTRAYNVEMTSAQPFVRACETCHPSSEMRDSSKGGASVDVKQAQVFNPHAILEDGTHDGMACTDCHLAHSSESLQENSVQYCVSCHHELTSRCVVCHS